MLRIQKRDQFIVISDYLYSMNNSSEEFENKEEIVSYQSERHIICIQEFETVYKIFQIIFNKESIYIDFPYYLKNSGILSVVTFPGNIKLPTNLSLISESATTTNLVKYSHHPDGESHFSKDGKILTRIRKKSVPLNDLNGHLFSIHVQGIKDFKQYVHNNEDNQQFPNNEDKKTPLKKKHIILQLEGPEPDSIKIVGRLFTKQYFLSLLNKPHDNPLFIQRSKKPVVLHRVQKKVYQICGWVICPPLNGDYGNYVLVISYSKIQKLCNDSYSKLVFIGGFDNKKITRDHSRNTKFLSFIYPFDNVEKIKQLLSCIDIRSKSD